MAEAGSGAALEALLREAEGSDWASLLARLAELQAEWERLAAAASRADEPVLVEVSSRVGRALLGGADALSLLAVARESRLEGEGEPLAGRQDWARLRGADGEGVGRLQGGGEDGGEAAGEGGGDRDAVGAAERAAVGGVAHPARARIAGAVAGVPRGSGGGLAAPAAQRGAVRGGWKGAWSMRRMRAAESGMSWASLRAYSARQAGGRSRLA